MAIDKGPINKKWGPCEQCGERILNIKKTRANGVAMCCVCSGGWY